MSEGGTCKRIKDVKISWKTKSDVGLAAKNAAHACNSAQSTILTNLSAFLKQFSFNPNQSAVLLIRPVSSAFSHVGLNATEICCFFVDCICIFFSFLFRHFSSTQLYIYFDVDCILSTTCIFFLSCSVILAWLNSIFTLHFTSHSLWFLFLSAVWLIVNGHFSISRFLFIV